MTAKCALALALLEGRVLNVGTIFKETGLSNAGREIPRMIEKPFNLVVSRIPRTGKSRYGNPVSYMDYRLNKDAPYNKEGIIKLREYCEKHSSLKPPPPSVKPYLKQDLFAL